MVVTVGILSSSPFVTVCSSYTKDYELRCIHSDPGCRVPYHLALQMHMKFPSASFIIPDAFFVWMPVLGFTAASDC